MKRALILKNIKHEDPGLVEIGLAKRDWSFDVVDIYLGEKIPQDPNSYDLLVVLGGPASANDQSEIIEFEIALIKSWIEQRRPYLGVCLGLQLLAKASGLKVVPCDEKEIGFIDPRSQPYEVELTEAGRKDPLFENLQSKLKVFQLHADHVEINDDRATILASSKQCAEQVVKFYPKAYGLQCHFELTPIMLEEWTEEDPDLIPLGKDYLLPQYQKIHTEYQKTGMQIVSNFLKIIEG